MMKQLTRNMTHRQSPNALSIWPHRQSRGWSAYLSAVGTTSGGRRCCRQFRTSIRVPIIDLRYHHRKPPDFVCGPGQSVCWDGLGMMGMHSESVTEPLDAYVSWSRLCDQLSFVGLLNVDPRTYPSYDTDLPHRSQRILSRGPCHRIRNSTT
jgi:hypothetical protein